MMDAGGIRAPLVSDLVASGLAAVTAAPLVAILDEAVTLSAAGKKNLWNAIGDKLVEVAKSPVSFFVSAPFIWMWAVYALTYASANAAETIASVAGLNPATAVLVCSTMVNMVMCLLKDSAFARMYGGDGKKDDDDNTAKLSSTVLSVWFVRDIVTQFFVFTIPLLLLGKAPDLIVRLGAPVLAQYVTTPFHLLGMRLYNLPRGTSVSSQWKPVKGMLFSTICARQMRIFPAFSVSGVLNKQLRVMLLAFLAG